MAYILDTEQRRHKILESAGARADRCETYADNYMSDDNKCRTPQGNLLVVRAANEAEDHYFEVLDKVRDLDAAANVAKKPAVVWWKPSSPCPADQKEQPDEK